MKKISILEIVLIVIIAICLVIIFTNTNVADTKEVATEEVEEETTEKLLYGTVEYVSAVPTDEWVVGDIDFQPIDCSLDVEIQEFIYYLAYGYNIDFCFIMAVIEHESDYRANLISKTNDYGLMQINKCNHEWLGKALGITDFLDPYQNVMAGTYKFHILFEKYQGDTAKVLMAYNMGNTGAKRLWDKGIYETKYSREIMQQIAEWKGSK